MKKSELSLDKEMLKKVGMFSQRSTPRGKEKLALNNLMFVK